MLRSKVSRSYPSLLLTMQPIFLRSPKLLRFTRPRRRDLRIPADHANVRKRSTDGDGVLPLQFYRQSANVQVGEAEETVGTTVPFA